MRHDPTHVDSVYQNRKGEQLVKLIIKITLISTTQIFSSKAQIYDTNEISICKNECLHTYNASTRILIIMNLLKFELLNQDKPHQ